MRKYLNTEQENWLFQHFPTMTNEDLAKELTKMVQEENKKQVKRLEGLLPNITDANTRRTVLRQIASFKKHCDISVALVKSNARRLKCKKKALALRSESSRKNALQTNIKKWKEKAVKVSTPMSWFRTFLVNETRICCVRDRKEMNNIRACMSTWNRLEGQQKGIFLMGNYVPEANIMRIVARINITE